jgi:uncharacterized membrane protein
MAMAARTVRMAKPDDDTKVDAFAARRTRSRAMESRTKVMGHPLHPLLVAFPIGLLATSLGFDIVGIFSGNPTWREASFYMIAVGAGMGLVAGVFGFLDWLAIPKGTRAKFVGLAHALGNVGMLTIFTVSWILRLPQHDTTKPLPIILSIVGVGILLVTGWLGNELVNRLGVGIHKDANLNAPSSIGHHRKVED